MLTYLKIALQDTIVEAYWRRLKRNIWSSNRNDGFNWVSKVNSVQHSNSSVGNLSSPKVLVCTSAAGHLTALNFEALVACALRVRNASVDFMLCDGALSACMECTSQFFPGSTVKKLSTPGLNGLCGGCTPVGQRVLHGLRFNILYYSKFIDASQKDTANSFKVNIPLAEIRDFELDGIDIGMQAYAGCLRFFAKSDINDEPHAEYVLREYLYSAILTYFALSNLFSKTQYDVCVLNHGIYVPQGIVVKVCEKFNIRVVTWNPGYRNGCFLFSHKASYHYTMLEEPKAEWENIQWNKVKQTKILEYLRSRSTGEQDWIKWHSKPNLEFAGEAIGAEFDTTKHTAVAYTNVLWDAQLHFHQNAFENMLDWLHETVAWYSRNPDKQLIIRIHPAEITGTLRSRQRVRDELQAKFPEMSKNIFIIDPENNLSSYKLASLSDVAIIYGTKIGVELAAIGMPVIVAGEAWIRNKGFTTDIKNRSEYEEVLNRITLLKKLKNEKLVLAQKYAYYFFFARMIQVNFMSSRSGWPSLFPNITNNDDFEVGKDIGLDIICNGILSEKSFVDYQR